VHRNQPARPIGCRQTSPAPAFPRSGQAFSDERWRRSEPVSPMHKPSPGGERPPVPSEVGRARKNAAGQPAFADLNLTQVGLTSQMDHLFPEMPSGDLRQWVEALSARVAAVRQLPWWIARCFCRGRYPSWRHSWKPGTACRRPSEPLSCSQFRLGFGPSAVKL